MNRLEHRYEAEQWVDLVEGTLPAEEAAAMKEHVAGCGQCRATYEDLRLSREHLLALSARLAAAPGGTEAGAARIRQAVLARIRITQAASTELGMAAGVDELRRILQPLCGQATTEGALRNAARRCSAVSAEAITPAEWGAFVAQLGTIMDAICGASVAQWISTTARGIGWEADPSC